MKNFFAWLQKTYYPWELWVATVVLVSLNSVFIMPKHDRILQNWAFVFYGVILVLLGIALRVHKSRKR